MRATATHSTGSRGVFKNPALTQKAFDSQIARAGSTGEKDMTSTGTYLKTGLLLLLFIVSGAFGWTLIKEVDGQVVDVNLIWIISGFVMTIGLAIAARFAGKWIWLVAIGYALAQGIMVGTMAHILEVQYPGIALRAVLITLALYVSAWLLYTTGVIKVTPGYRTAVMIGTLGVAVFFGVNFLLSLFGVNLSILNEPSWLSILIAVGILLLGVLNLPMDFDFIRTVSAAGAPKFMEWQGAFGLIVTIVWIYVSVLRLLSLTRSR